MELERKALYNLLRMNKPDGSSTLPWQVKNYAQLSTDLLFKELAKLGFPLDTRHFLALSETSDSPEELCDSLVPEEVDAKQSDHLFLILFELWRKLTPEKPSLSIICNELDEQIYLYDEGICKTEEALQDAIGNLLALLKKNVDEGLDAEGLFEIVQANTANDVESFLYDYIAEKIDEEAYVIASELLDDFIPFVHDREWFEFLRARILANQDPQKANDLIHELLTFEDILDAEFGLEMLHFLAHFGDHKLFLTLARKTLALLETEDEFQDLLTIISEYFRCLDQEEMEQKIIAIFQKRSRKSLENPIDPNDPDLKNLHALLN